MENIRFQEEHDDRERADNGGGAGGGRHREFAVRGREAKADPGRCIHLQKDLRGGTLFVFSNLHLIPGRLCPNLKIQAFLNSNL